MPVRCERIAQCIPCLNNLRTAHTGAFFLCHESRRPSTATHSSTFPVPTKGVHASDHSPCIGPRFYYICAIMVNANSVFTTVQPDTTAGRFAAVIIASWGVSVAVVVLSMVAGPVFVPIGRIIRVHYDSYCYKRAIRKLFLLTLIIIPVNLLLVCAILAGPLAGMEGWTWDHGFWWLCSLMTALHVPLTAEEPQTHWGKLVALMFDAWSLGLMGLALATLGLSICPIICEKLGFGGYVNPKAQTVVCVCLGNHCVCTLFSVAPIAPPLITFCIARSVRQACTRPVASMYPFLDAP